MGAGKLRRGVGEDPRAMARRASPDVRTGPRRSRDRHQSRRAPRIPRALPRERRRSLRRLAEAPGPGPRGPLLRALRRRFPTGLRHGRGLLRPRGRRQGAGRRAVEPDGRAHARVGGLRPRSFAGRAGDPPAALQPGRAQGLRGRVHAAGGPVRHGHRELLRPGLRLPDRQVPVGRGHRGQCGARRGCAAVSHA